MLLNVSQNFFALTSSDILNILRIKNLFHFYAENVMIAIVGNQQSPDDSFINRIWTRIMGELCPHMSEMVNT